MITCLTFDDTQSCIIRGKTTKDSLVITNQIVFESITPHLLSNDQHSLETVLTDISAGLDLYSDIWYCTLPLAMLTWKCEKIPLLDIPEPPNELANDWLLKYLPEELDKNEYLPYLVDQKSDQHTAYVTLAFAERKTVRLLVEATQKTGIALIYIESQPLSLIRYLQWAFPNSAEIVHIRKNGSMLLSNELGCITYKGSGAFNYSDLIIFREMARTHFTPTPEKTIYTADTELELTELEITPIPNLPGCELAVNSEYLAAQGLLLKNLQMQKGAVLRNAYQKLFKQGNSTSAISSKI